MDLTITKKISSNLKLRPNETELGFGKYTTDHMFMMEYSKERGWYNPRIEPYQALKLDPAASVLHYNQEVFEGLKAYHLQDGSIGLFRPDKNIARMNNSSKRLVIPEIDPDFLLKAIKELILVDKEWIPESDGTSLYIRPTIIATEPALGVKPSGTYLFYIILCPVGSYYPEGFNPTRIFVSDKYIRAAKGGMGEAKTSGNYCGTLLISQQAISNGYTQVLWLDAKELKYVEEVGTSNIFFYMDDELITPPLNGTILPGVTRDSVLKIARSWGLNVSERQISIDEVMDGCKSGSLKEMFASGTAAVISPVGEISYKAGDYRVGNGKTGELSEKFYNEITSIQYGRKKDPFGWLVRID